MSRSFLDFMMDESTASSSLTKLQENLKTRGTGNNIFYRYKNMDYNSTCTIRFLPASSEIAENDVQPEFWLPKKVLRLRFENPEQQGSEVILRIPARQMYTGEKTENDPVLKQAKALFDEAEKLKKAGREEESKQVQAKGSYHWHRGECIAQGFVNRSPFFETELSENPIRLFELTKQIMNVINATLKSDDPAVKLEYWPCHGKLGTDFVIKKTKSGDWPKYDGGSCFARHPSPWTTEQHLAFDKYGLFRLEDFLPTRPTDEEYQMLAEIVRQSIEGERVWNPDWENHFETIKVYKTGQNENSDVDAETLQSQVRDSLNKLSGSGSSSSSDILTSLRTGQPLPEVDETEVEGDEPETQVSVPTKSAEQVRNVVDRIKGRTSGKTATV
jgi:hypothetical protein